MSSSDHSSSSSSDDDELTANEGEPYEFIFVFICPAGVSNDVRLQLLEVCLDLGAWKLLARFRKSPGRGAMKMKLQAFQNKINAR